MAKVVTYLVPSRLQPWWYIMNLAASKTHGTVQSGPFRGMRHIGRSYLSALTPKLLGIYERELRDCIEEAITFPFQTVLDIGAAEGYYAVGLALRMRDTRVIAFEMDPSARELLMRMVELNGVESRVAIKELCTSRDLAATLKTSGLTLVICDAEGGEALLLDPIRVPELEACHILVELHDYLVGGVSEEIRDRFTTTHSITQICQEVRDRSEFPYQTLYTKVIPSCLDLGVSEFRPAKMAWYWMRPFKAGTHRGMTG
jgi:predicted O-methyltransferase YrrM